MKKRRKKKIVLIVIMVFSLVIAFFCGYKLISGNTGNTERKRSEREIRINREKIENSAYYMETAYEGADVPHQLYEVPFADENSSDYSCNSDLVGLFGDDYVQSYVSYAKEYMELLFGSNCYDISNDAGLFQGNLIRFYNPDATVVAFDGEETSPQDFANAITEMYVDNSLECTANFETDRSLFYRRNNIYCVRGALFITPSSQRGKKGERCEVLYEKYGIECNYGETTCIMAEVEFSPTQQTVEVAGLRLMQYIEE